MRSMICSRCSLSRNLTSRLLHLAAAFDVDLVRAVDQDVADRRVLEQHLQRPEAERLVEHLVDEPLALHAVEQRVFGVAQALDDQADFARSVSPSRSLTRDRSSLSTSLPWMRRFSSSKLLFPPA